MKETEKKLRSRFPPSFLRLFSFLSAIGTGVWIPASAGMTSRCAQHTLPAETARIMSRAKPRPERSRTGRQDRNGGAVGKQLDELAPELTHNNRLRRQVVAIAAAYRTERR
jgi:hypothetical protein